MQDSCCPRSLSQIEKAENNISVFDRTVSDLFYRDDSAKCFFELFSLGGINYGKALQSNIYELLVQETIEFNNASRSSMLNNFKIKIRRWGIDQLYKLLISFFSKPNKSYTYPRQKKTVFFAENYVRHILDDFIKVIREMEQKDEVLFVSNDRRSIKYVNAEFPDVDVLYIGLHTLNAKQIFTALKKVKILNKIVKQNKKITKEQFKEFGDIGSKIYFTQKFNFFILPFYAQLFQVILNRVRPSKFVVGCDAFSLSRICIDQCKKDGIETLVIQHGMLQGYNGYLPLYADGIFLWSQKEKEFFEKMGFMGKKLLVTGAPRFSGIKANEVRPKKRITIAFISSDTYISEVEKTLDHLEEVSNNLQVPFRLIFRPHPHIKLLIKRMFESRKSRLRNIEIDSNTSIDKTLDITDFGIVSNCSTTIFEIAARGIPFCIAEGHGKEDVGINLYNFERSTTMQIVYQIHFFYRNQLTRSSLFPKTPYEKEMACGDIHMLSTKKIGKYLAAE